MIAGLTCVYFIADISHYSMPYRLIVLIVILAFGSHAWGAGCTCDDAKPAASCCKRDIERSSYLAARDCCPDSEGCAVGGSEGRIATRNSAGTVSQSALDLKTTAFVRSTFVISLKDEPVRDTTATGRYRNWPRPPDLYVRHHAFRI